MLHIQFQDFRQLRSISIAVYSDQSRSIFLARHSSHQYYPAIVCSLMLFSFWFVRLLHHSLLLWLLEFLGLCGHFPIVWRNLTCLRLIYIFARFSDRQNRAEITVQITADLVLDLKKVCLVRS